MLSFVGNKKRIQTDVYISIITAISCNDAMTYRKNYRNFFIVKRRPQIHAFVEFARDPYSISSKWTMASIMPVDGKQVMKMSIEDRC